MYFLTPGLDMDVFMLVNQSRSPLLDALMPLVSSKLAMFTLMALACAWMVKRYGKKQLVYFLILLAGMGCTDFSTKQIKDATDRLRPMNSVAGTYYMNDQGWTQRPPDYVTTKKTRGTSYPSAHAANTMVLAVLTMLIWPRLTPWMLVLPLATGYSRLYLGKHFPTDVLAGWLFGLVVAGLLWLLWKRIKPMVFQDES